MKTYVTFHIQKDGRIFLGTVGHSTKECPALKGRDAFEIDGEVAAMIPSCQKCGYVVDDLYWLGQKVADA